MVFAVFLITYALSYFVTDPGHVFPGTEGDGVKNGFTYLYHSIYGKGYWFEGMNYPYGEHIVFTDGIPLFSVFFAAIGNVPATAALSALWWGVALSYVLSVVYLYKSLLRLGLPRVWAMVGAGLVTVLSPQCLRLRGHYGLSFMCLIPMMLYWTLAWYQDRNRKYWWYIFLAGLVFSFLHPYFAGVVLVWVCFFGLMFLIAGDSNFRERLRQMWLPVLLAAAVSATVMLLVRLTDTAGGRLEVPYTSAEGYATFNRLLSSIFSPFWALLAGKSDSLHVAEGGEGFAYPGLVPLAVLVIAGVVWAVRAKNGSKTPETRLGWIAVLMISGVAAFSMGVPLRWELPGLRELMFPFRQFRTIGRFAWISYYVLGVFSVAVIYRWFAALVGMGRRRIAMTLLILATGVWATEAYGYMRAMRRVADVGRYNYGVMWSTQEKGWVQFLTENGKRAEDFQALLLLKYFNVGTDILWIGEPGWLMTLGARAAMQLHLPMVNAMMARSSIPRAQDIAKMVAGPHAEKPILNRLSNNKPFLLLSHDVDALSADEAYLLAASDYIGEFSQCKIYACYPQRIRDSDRRARDSARAIAAGLAPAADTCLGDCDNWYVAHFGAEKNKWLFGQGGAGCIAGRDSVVARIAVAPVKDSAVFEFSCWFMLEMKDYRSPDVVLTLEDGSGKAIGEITVNTRKAVDSRGQWYRASAYFYMPAASRKVVCRVINEPAPAYLAMDELMLRSANATIISKGPSGFDVMVNGHGLVWMGR